jgi:hypothetical protein
VCGFRSNGFGPCLSIARKREFYERIQRDLPCPVTSEKTIFFSIDPNHLYIPARLIPHEGRIAIVTDAGWDVVDAAALGAIGIAGRASACERRTGAQDERRCCVRQNRVVPTPVAGAKLSVAKSIQPDSISYQAGSDGDKTNSLAEESAV